MAFLNNQGVISR